MEPKIRPLRCPKCRGRDLHLVEIYETSMTFHQCADGQVRRVWGHAEHENEAAEGRCLSCKHVWRFRRTKQVPRMLERQGERDECCECEPLPRLVKVPEPTRLAGAVSEYEVYLGDVHIGWVAQDDEEPAEPGGARHLWHAWLVENTDEALPMRYATRASAVLDLCIEYRRPPPPSVGPDPRPNGAAMKWF